MNLEDIIRVRYEMPKAPSHQTILSTVVATMESLVQDWDLTQPIDAETRLVADLGFESIDLIQMAAALEQEFGHSSVVFADLLIVDGRYVDDLTVGQIAEALATGMASNRSAQ